MLLSALVTAGAFAAFLSTASGLTVSVAGVLSQDVLPRTRGLVGRGPGWRGRTARIRSFRLGAVAAIVVPYLLSLPSEHLGLAAVVGLAFAIAAATFCPLLVLGVWWPRLTAPGALAGLIVGGVLATAAVLVTLDRRGGGWLDRGAARTAGGLGGAPHVRGHGRRLARRPATGFRPTSVASWCACTRPSRWPASCATLDRSAG